MVDAIDATQSRGCILNDHDILKTDNVHGYPIGMYIINVYPQRRFSISEISDHGSRRYHFEIQTRNMMKLVIKCAEIVGIVNKCEQQIIRLVPVVSYG